MNPKVVMYTKNPCPYCNSAKEFFKSRNIAFDTIDLTDRPDEYDDLKKKTGHMTVPQIFINDTFVGGYMDLKSKYQAGEFKGIIP